MATVGEYVQASMLPACVYPPSGQYCTESLPSGCRRIPGPITRNPVLSFWQTHPTTVAGENSPPRPALRGCGAAAIPRGPPPHLPRPGVPRGPKAWGASVTGQKEMLSGGGPAGTPTYPTRPGVPRGPNAWGGCPTAHQRSRPPAPAGGRRTPVCRQPPRGTGTDSWMPNRRAVVPQGSRGDPPPTSSGPGSRGDPKPGEQA